MEEEKMALVKVSTMLRKADQLGKAVVGVDCFNYETINCVIQAAEEQQIPVIIMYYPCETPAVTFAAIVRTLAERATVDVGLILDHGDSYETVMECIGAGFPSVMIDCSALPFEENVEKTREVVRTAHLLGVDVEAELGHVGDALNEDDYKKTDMFSDPDKVAEFVERTGVDSLAVAIGSAHGFYVSEPNLDLERLEKINQITDIPLVLHGGSGIPFAQVQGAIRRGINKLNIGTEYDREFGKAYQECLAMKGENELTFELAPVLLKKVKPYIAKNLRMAWMEDSYEK